MKTTTIAIRLTNKEKQQIKIQAHKELKTMSEYLRDLAINKIN